MRALLSNELDNIANITKRRENVIISKQWHQIAKMMALISVVVYLGPQKIVFGILATTLVMTM